MGRLISIPSDGESYSDQKLVWVHPDGFDLEPIKAVATTLGFDFEGGNQAWLRDMQGNVATAEAFFNRMRGAFSDAGFEPVAREVKSKVCFMAEAGGVTFGAQACGDKLNSVTAMVSLPVAIKWETLPPVYHGDILGCHLDVPSEAFEKERVVYDLQQGSDYCFTAVEIEVCDIKYICLYGNGWREMLGYPIEEGSPRYPLIGGKTRARFIKAFETDSAAGGDFGSVWSGDLRDFHSWDVIEKEGKI